MVRRTLRTTLLDALDGAVRRVRTAPVRLAYAYCLDLEPDDSPHFSLEYDIGDTSLYLVDPDGLVVARSRSHGFLRTELSHTATKEGAYTLVVTGDAPTESLRYTLYPRCDW